MIHPELLSRYRLFDNMQAEDLSAIARALRIVEVDKGEVIFEQYKPHTGVYLVYSGSVKYGLTSPSGKEVILGIYGPGESFEDITIFFEYHGCRAVAVEDSLLYSLPRTEIIGLMRERPRMALDYFRNLTHSMLKLRFGVLNSLLNDAERRLSTYLMSLMDSQAAGRKKGVRITLPMKKSLIASYLGMTAETFSRTLQALRKSGCIETRGRTVVIRNPDALSRRAVRL